jgi:hypothetical protein
MKLHFWRATCYRRVAILFSSFLTVIAFLSHTGCTQWRQPSTGLSLVPRHTLFAVTYRSHRNASCIDELEADLVQLQYLRCLSLGEILISKKSFSSIRMPITRRPDDVKTHRKLCQSLSVRLRRDSWLVEFYMCIFGVQPVGARYVTGFPPLHRIQSGSPADKLKAARSRNFWLVRRAQDAW